MAEGGATETVEIATTSAATRQLHGLCSKCRDVFTLLESFPAEFTGDELEKTSEFHNIQDLIQSSINGCHLCTLIVTEMYPDTKQVLLSRIERNGTNGEHMTARINYWDPKKPRHGRYFVDQPMIYLEWPETGLPTGSDRDFCQLNFIAPKDEVEVYRLTRSVQPSTQSWETFNDIHHWLRQCELTHTKCRERKQQQMWKLPTRLLYIPASGGNNTVCLREADDIPPQSRYMTLSHRWGNAVGQKRLLAAEYASCVSGMPVDGLPQTFRDAVALARILGVEYLWIDSLCIIQDSHEDWARECSRMTDVYIGSFVNVAANDSANSDGGLFRKRDPLAVTPLWAPLTFAPTQWEGEPFILFPYSMGHGALYHAPLSSRAWVVQEQLLAPRTIHFLRHKVVWQCTSLYASESDTEGRVEEGHWSPVRNWAVREPKFPHASCLERWTNAIELYTRGNLTHESDKLVAISGIARYLQEISWQDDSLQYYAGLWSYQFEEQLLWFAAGDGHRTTAYQAPSWSWASYNGEIKIWNICYEDRHLLAESLETYVEPIADAFGPVRNGYLKIRGPLCRAQAVRSGDTWTRSMRLMPSGSRIEFSTLKFDEVGRMCHNGDNEFVLLGMVKQLVYVVVPMVGLVLEPTLAKHGEYRRVGYFEMNELLETDDESDDRGPPTTDYRGLEDAFASMDLAADLCESCDQAAKVYTISII